MPYSIPAIDALEEYIETTIGGVVPWQVVNAEAAGGKRLVVFLTYEIADFVTSVAGRPVPPGTIGAGVILTLVAPETDPMIGTRTAAAALAELAPILDAHPGIYWDKAEKGRFSSGETIYRINIEIISNY